MNDKQQLISGQYIARLMRKIQPTNKAKPTYLFPVVRDVDYVEGDENHERIYITWEVVCGAETSAPQTVTISSEIFKPLRKEKKSIQTDSCPPGLKKKKFVPPTTLTPVLKEEVALRLLNSIGVKQEGDVLNLILNDYLLVGLDRSRQTVYVSWYIQFESFKNEPKPMPVVMPERPDEIQLPLFDEENIAT